VTLRFDVTVNRGKILLRLLDVAKRKIVACAGVSAPPWKAALPFDTLAGAAWSFSTPILTPLNTMPAGFATPCLGKERFRGLSGRRSSGHALDTFLE
jgi:hypothetical protein